MLELLEARGGGAAAAASMLELLEARGGGAAAASMLELAEARGRGAGVASGLRPELPPPLRLSDLLRELGLVGARLPLGREVGLKAERPVTGPKATAPASASSSAANSACCSSSSRCICA